jgi:hypothetical protein
MNVERSRNSSAVMSRGVPLLLMGPLVPHLPSPPGRSRSSPILESVGRGTWSVGRARAGTARGFCLASARFRVHSEVSLMLPEQ